MLFGQRRIEASSEAFPYYLARNKNGMVWLYCGVPRKIEEKGIWVPRDKETHTVGGWHDEDKKAFPNVLWTDEFPAKVKVEVVL